MALLKEIRCISPIEWTLKNPDTKAETRIPICYHYIDDMPVGVGEKTYYCCKCKTTWRVRQTEDRNLHYSPIKKGEPERKEYDDHGVAILEDSE